MRTLHAGRQASAPDRRVGITAEMVGAGLKVLRDYGALETTSAADAVLVYHILAAALGAGGWQPQSSLLPDSIQKTEFGTGSGPKRNSRRSVVVLEELARSVDQKCCDEDCSGA